MPIRITGMYSGLDTEAIISELVSAQSVKKSKYVKDQIKLSWKMDAWKALNTKIFNFYTNTLDNMRYQATYLKKTTKVSNPNVLSATVNGEAVNGLQGVTVDQLARSGKLTGRDLSEDYGNVKGTTKLSQLGIEGDANFAVTVGGKTTKITLNGDMTINDVVAKLQNAGISANYDETNHRLFLSSKTTGEAADFTLAANDEAGLKALENLGILSREDLASDEYKKWAGYRRDTDAYQKVIETEVAKRAAAYKQNSDALTKQNEELTEQIKKLKEEPNYQDGVKADDLYEELYGPEVQKEDEHGPVRDENGEPVMERRGGLKAELDQAKEALAAAQKELDDRVADTENPIDEAEKAELQKKIEDAGAKVTEAQANFDAKNGQYSITKAIEDREEQIEKNKNTITDNEKYYSVDPDTDAVSGTQALTDQVTEEFDKKVALAEDIVGKVASGAYDSGKYGVRVEGSDAVIHVDGAEFTSASNNFNINGLSITVYETSAEEVTITTTDDVDGVYDMIKNFFKEYNSLINEMSALYNADSAKGYDPLTSEEKAELSDSEIEEWEKKIKDSLLRRDETLGDISSVMKNVLLQGATVNGKQMYLSDFGINTLGYFNAGDNEKSAYHIDGDPDDASTKSKNDVLKSMISSDPDTVMEFFSGLSKNLYETLTEKMKSVDGTRSMFTVYNDKLMQKEYDNYKDRIAKEEEKLNALMDKWYSKFSQMETAMAKLQSKSGSLSGMLGGS